jgi:transcriptional regulator with XRE-family HTH domain
MPAEAVVSRLEALLTDAGWPQALLAERLRVSPATVTRVLTSRVASASFIARAERLLDETSSKAPGSADYRDPRDAPSKEFHLLQEMYGLLVRVSSRVEALAAESLSRGGFEKDVK